MAPGFPNKRTEQDEARPKRIGHDGDRNGCDGIPQRQNRGPARRTEQRP